MPFDEGQTLPALDEEWAVMIDDGSISRTRYRTREDAERAAQKWNRHGSSVQIVTRKVSRWSIVED